eukprot:SAG11_NODE_1793_length_4252_cov_6.530701_1_plen_712_part_10
MAVKGELVEADEHAERLEELRANVQNLRREVKLTKPRPARPSNSKRPPSLRKPSRTASPARTASRRVAPPAWLGNRTGAAAIAAALNNGLEPAVSSSTAHIVRQRERIMARLSCSSEGWLYDVTCPYITFGRHLLHDAEDDEEDDDFCHISVRRAPSAVRCMPGCHPSPQLSLLVGMRCAWAELGWLVSAQDDEAVLPEHFAVVCENPFVEDRKLRRFVLQVLGVAPVMLRGAQYTHQDGSIPLENLDTITITGSDHLDVIFALPPSGHANASSGAQTAADEWSSTQEAAQRSAEERTEFGEAALKALAPSSQPPPNPIVRAARSGCAVSGAGSLGSLCAADGSVFRIRKTKTVVAPWDSPTPSKEARASRAHGGSPRPPKGVDCCVRSLAATPDEAASLSGLRALISCELAPTSTEGSADGGISQRQGGGGHTAQRSFSVRCMSRDVPLILNGIPHSAYDGPCPLSSHDVLRFGSAELVFCLPGEVAVTNYNRAAMTIQRSWRGFVARTDGKILLLQEARHLAATKLQNAWLLRKNGPPPPPPPPPPPSANLDEDTAATMLQACWRGNRAREDLLMELLSSDSDIDSDEDEDEDDLESDIDSDDSAAAEGDDSEGDELLTSDEDSDESDEIDSEIDSDIDSDELLTSDDSEHSEDEEEDSEQSGDEEEDSEQSGDEEEDSEHSEDEEEDSEQSGDEEEDSEQSGDEEEDSE